MITKNRLRNKAMWLAIFAFIPMLVEGLTTYEIFILLPGNYNQLYVALLSIFVLAGIVNDPNTEDTWYTDDGHN